jgi:hypothetical protein
MVGDDRTINLVAMNHVLVAPVGHVMVEEGSVSIAFSKV